MAKKVTLAPALVTEAERKDASLVIAAMSSAFKADDKAEQARTFAQRAGVAMIDASIASFGTADVLRATDKSKANDVLKAGYTEILNAFIGLIWTPAFAAWVNGEGKDQDRAAKRGGATGDRRYWRQQAGSRFKKFVDRAFAAHEAATTAPSEDGRAPNRNVKPLDAACRDNVVAALKRMDKAVADKADIPPNVNVAAFTALAMLATFAIDTARAKQGKAEAALKALRAAKIID